MKSQHTADRIAPYQIVRLPKYRYAIESKPAKAIAPAPKPAQVDDSIAITRLDNKALVIARDYEAATNWYSDRLTKVFPEGCGMVVDVWYVALDKTLKRYCCFAWVR